jgi:hypothetical protein
MQTLAAPDQGRHRAGEPLGLLMLAVKSFGAHAAARIDPNAEDSASEPKPARAQRR